MEKTKIIEYGDAKHMPDLSCLQTFNEDLMREMTGSLVSWGKVVN